MTARELAALWLALAGGGLMVVGAGFLWGWPAGVATTGVLMVIGGLLLGLGDEPANDLPPAP